MIFILDHVIFLLIFLISVHDDGMMVEKSVDETYYNLQLCEIFANKQRKSTIHANGLMLFRLLLSELQ